MYKRLLLIIAGLSLLAGCGGGGSGGGDSSSATATVTIVQDNRKAWIRSYLDDVYLWYNEIIDVPPANYSTGPDYFEALLVKSRDRFSYSMPLAKAVSEFQEGRDTGFGVTWGWATSARLYALYVDPNSPAAVSLTRGTEITAINGQPVAGLSNSILSSALFPDLPGASLTLTFRLPGTSTTRTTTLLSATYAATTVAQPQIITIANGAKAGYLLFNQHLRTSEQGLVNAMTYFKQQGVGELVLDLRYNTGGYLSIAGEVASMIGGAPLQSKVFEKLLFNDKHPEKTADPKNTYRFTAIDSKGAPLPLLGLQRIFILTGPSTCSASESIINGLQPFIPVVRIGWTTCGKPYGSIQANYDQQAYFAVQSEGVNADGSNDFKSGFAPTCTMYDDLNHPLGDADESLLHAALSYMGNNICPPATVGTLPRTALPGDRPVNESIQPLGLKPGLKLLQ